MMMAASWLQSLNFQQWLLIGVLGVALIGLSVALAGRRRRPFVPHDWHDSNAGAYETANARAADDQTSRRGGPPSAASTGTGLPGGETAFDIGQLQVDLGALLNELENLSGRITTQVEAEFGRLQGLLAEADRRIAALRILIEASRQARSAAGASAGLLVGPLADALEDPFTGPAGGLVGGPVGGPGETLPGPAAPAASVASPAMAASTATASPIAAMTTAPAAASPAWRLEEDPHFAEVYRLADGGMSAADIACQIDETPATVELVLSLRAKQR